MKETRKKQPDENEPERVGENTICRHCRWGSMRAEIDDDESSPFAEPSEAWKRPAPKIRYRGVCRSPLFITSDEGKDIPMFLRSEVVGCDGYEPRPSLPAQKPPKSP